MAGFDVPARLEVIRARGSEFIAFVATQESGATPEQRLGRYVVMCPNRHTGKPAFEIWIDEQGRGTCHCCGWTGDVVAWLAAVKNVGEVAALEELEAVIAAMDEVSAK